MGRIAYGTSYFGVRDPRHTRRDLDRLADAGLDIVLHTFSEGDQRHYRGTMEDIVGLSQDRGFTVYVNPWGVGNVFGGEALSDFPSRFPDVRQQLADGQSVPAACFNAPRFRNFMHEWIGDAVSTGADVIFWDEPHWYEPGFRDDHYSSDVPTGRCPHCRQKYESIHGEPMPDHETDRTSAFKRQSLLEFLAEMTETVARSGVRNALCVEPTTSFARDPSPLEELDSLEELDVLGVTPFWYLYDEDPEGFVQHWSERITSLADDYDLESQIWIQGFGLDDHETTRRDFQRALRTAKSHDPNSIMVWGWDASRVMSSIACESPDLIWERFMETMAP